ncbi:MAG: site-specific DNA-methyltransferase, partial [Chloroflexi bacterium]|nr:site-specific DNA-methyltransferase [Chloroflexota bacterium]
MPELKTNVLYYGDNLDILRNYIPDESVDLVYLDPPFNSNASYNVLFKEPTGERSAAQIKAFDDTWHWDTAAELTYQEIVTNSPLEISKMVEAMRWFIGSNDMMVYLVMMTIRLIELRQALKPTGSLYLHCDPTASHYLKVVMDTIFGKGNFRNEIVWRRTGSYNQPKRYGPIHDILLFYSKSNAYFFKRNTRAFLRGHVDSYFRKQDDRGKYWTNALTGAGTRRGESGLAWRGFNPTDRGRHWAVPGTITVELEIPATLSVQEKLEALYQQGYIQLPSEGSKAMPTFKQYLDDSKGIPYQDIWAYQPHTKGVLYNTDDCIDDDVRWLPRQAKLETSERLGYQTQKPLGLLQRIIKSSSSEGDVVLDPFCGCGTAVVAAHKLNRKWIGIDLTHLAIAVMRKRLRDSFPGIQLEVIGEPVDVEGAKALAKQDRYQFQWWALSLVDALPVQEERKKGADKGMDGVITFIDGPSNKVERAIV